MTTCPQCQGDHTLSQCPRWKAPQAFLPCSPECNGCESTRDYGELCAVVLPAPHEPVEAA